MKWTKLVKVFWMKLNTLTISDNKAESDEKVAVLRKTLNEYLVYVLYSKARDHYNNAQYQPTLDLLKPVLDELMADGPGTGKKATLKGNKPLLGAILGYGMRSLIQLGRVPEGMKVLESWEKLIKEAGGEFDLKKDSQTIHWGNASANQYSFSTER